MLQPTAITASKSERTLTITWSDGKIGTISWDGLRLACPCVECKGGHENMGNVPSPIEIESAVITDLQLEALNPVGSYAICPIWNDGHATGIYTYQLLYLLTIR